MAWNSVPKARKGNRIDILLGADHYELMYLIKEVTGGLNEPCARLCPLGWTAIGKIQNLDTKKSHYTGFHHTFCLQIEKREPTLPERDTLELNYLLKRFWDLESIGIIPTCLQLTPKDKLAWDKVNNSLKFNGQDYEVAALWRDERHSYQIIYQW